MSETCFVYAKRVFHSKRTSFVRLLCNFESGCLVSFGQHMRYARVSHDCILHIIKIIIIISRLFYWYELCNVIEKKRLPVGHRSIHTARAHCIIFHSNDADTTHCLRLKCVCVSVLNTVYFALCIFVWQNASDVDVYRQRQRPTDLVRF